MRILADECFAFSPSEGLHEAYPILTRGLQGQVWGACALWLL